MRFMLTSAISWRCGGTQDQQNVISRCLTAAMVEDVAEQLEK
jgi:hypothetical protein